MFGFSVYLNEDLTATRKQWIKDMANSGFKGIFSSVHIPEEDTDKYIERLAELGETAANNDLSLTIDISGDSLQDLGITYSNVDRLKKWHVTGVRVDYGVDLQVVAELSYNIKVALNASTITREKLITLQRFNANFENIIAWHNFYPRVGTGLDEAFFVTQNELCHKFGLSVAAFVPGDDEVRGPLYEKLPSLEIHRSWDPFVASMNLMYRYATDRVYVGDHSIKEATQNRFQEFIENKYWLIRAKAYVSTDFIASYHLDTVHSTRPELSKKVIRSIDSRELINQSIPVENTILRKRGVVTLDNDNAGRYKGEFEIVKSELPEDATVNVVGAVLSEDCYLIDLIKEEQKFKIEWS